MHLYALPEFANFTLNLVLRPAFLLLFG